jgi:hypothetical protein
MIVIAALALMAQGTPPRQTVVRDSTKPDSSSTRTRIPQAIRRPVTAALLASAYKDSASRDLVAKGRAARVRQDSSISGYDAKVAQRLSVKAAVGSVTMERLAYRQENTARVQWQRDVGAHIEVTGARVTIPPVGMPKVDRDATQGLAADPELIPLPYFPGQEPLWVGSFKARPDVNEHSVLNPLANGSEAYYTYSSGDATTIRLGNGDSIVVRQVDVRPREATTNSVVGSLWLDDASGQVVRAAYRMAAPGGGSVGVAANDSATSKERVGVFVAQALLKTFVPTMIAEVTDIVVEYQRVRGFWLPRSQVMEGYVKASFARVPVTMENAFRFESVNETTALASITVDTLSTRTRRIDSTTVVSSLDQCKTASTRVVTAYKGDSIPVRITVPCNIDSLMTSAELPKSAFDEGEEIFGTAQRDALANDALSLLDQGPLRLLRWAPYFQYGVSHTRYNRIEGFSTALVTGQSLGGGYDVRVSGRIATADHTPRIEGSIGRSNARRAIRLGGYDRLVAMTDWETPLSFGSSLSAFFFGRDDAFYYRAGGIELAGTVEQGRAISWRAFLEEHRDAIPRTDFSVGGSFLPNLGVTPGKFFGLETRYRASRGLDPRGFRISSDIRLEGGAPTNFFPLRSTEGSAATPLRPLDSLYGRGMVELSMTQGFAAALDGALTLSAGTSAGELPIQRRWYLGGTQTIRGQGPSPALSGNAYWLTRAELARPVAFLRLAAFGDLGWAGDRASFTDVVRPFSGAGLGFSFLDGLARLDIARGIYPIKQTRVSFYLGSRF